MADETATPPGASISDIVVALNAANRNSSLLIQTMSSVLPRVQGSFTLSGAATTTVTEPTTKATSVITWIPTNAAAGTIEGSAKKLYLSARTAGSNFVLNTASAGTTAGTETFIYWLWNPS